ncbi:MAG TPA: TIGR01777 family oxidoreductase [Candidatus Bathyarchaeia archaeon]|nr:TIGR01777 family oxidoreductase [Candidatus Bathyarchaeia archaeon]
MGISKPLRIVIAGGSGQVGRMLARHFHGCGHAVTVIARHVSPSQWRTALWNGRDLDSWSRDIDGADVMINLAGRSVNCRYNEKNRREIMESRVQTTRVIGRAIAAAAQPPPLWMNASTATIYRHALDRNMDEATGEIGGNEPDVPSTWRFSIDVATAWERVFTEATTPQTRKIALRSAMIMYPSRGGIFDTLLRLVRIGLGGQAGSGDQFVSWIHGVDFIRAIEFLIAHEELDGTINVSSPHPLPDRDFMRALRRAWGAPIGLLATRWMLEIGAMLLRTETELILKSRRVVPARLLDAGFEFQFPQWPEAVQDLVRRWSEHRGQRAEK